MFYKPIFNTVHLEGFNNLMSNHDIGSDKLYIIFSTDISNMVFRGVQM